MRMKAGFSGAALLTVALLTLPLTAETVNINTSTDPASWTRAPNAGTGAAQVAGGPSVWNSTFTYSIPPGSTGISFRLDSLYIDDKGIVLLNGSNIADTVHSNNAINAAGVFDFGDGMGSVAYNFVGWSPVPKTIPLSDGTTNFSLVVLVNDTNTLEPAATPLPTTNISDFILTGALTFTAPGTETPTPTATETQTSPTATSTPTSPTAPTVAPPGPPAIPSLSGTGAAVLTLLLLGVALVVLGKLRS
jgi:hypothetical protein